MSECVTGPASAAQDGEAAAAPVMRWDAQGNKRLSAIGASCALGVFDGVHRGHQYLLSALIDDARARGVEAWVVTFDRDPDELFDEDAARSKILSNQDRLDTLSRQGVDGVLAAPFDAALAAMPPDQFCDEVLASVFEVASIHIGQGFRYGSHAAGTTDTLSAWAQRRGATVNVHHLYDDDGLHVSATRIRALLREGKVEAAARLLTRPYYMRGVVAAGRGVGRDLGFPTANLDSELPPGLLREGVYAGYVHIGPDRHKAAISVGAPATFGMRQVAIEPHILDFDGSIYGETITVEFIAFLRPMMAFESTQALQDTVNANIATARAILA